MLAAAIAASMWMLAIAPAVLAQDAPPRAPAPAEIARLPEDRRSPHTLALPDRTLRFTAIVGSIPMTNAAGRMLADVAFTAYLLDGADKRTRPLTFAFNGGPGAASTWLQLGALGPWRVPLTGETIRTKGAPALLDNAETWLDFTDLVFIDPPGTGVSRIWPTVERGTATEPPRGGGRGRGETQRAAESGGPAWFWSVRGDIATFASFIATWTRNNERTGSPIVLAGESYGGFRAPLIAQALKSDHAVAVHAMVLVSPVLDFDGRRGWLQPQHYVAMLPSIAATRLERSGVVPTRTALAEAETYARGDYLADLARGPRDTQASERIAARVAALTGLDAESVRRHDGRLGGRSFVQEAAGFGEKAVSLYDAGMSGLEPAGSEQRGFGDPFTSGLTEPLTAAMETLHARLGWRVARRYMLHSGEANRSWTWRNSPHPPEALGALLDLHRTDPKLATLVTHGFTDLVTPYFASALQLDQLPAHGKAQRIKLEVYPGGHMLYSRDGSRARFRDDAEKLIGETLQPNVIP